MFDRGNCQIYNVYISSANNGNEKMKNYSEMSKCEEEVLFYLYASLDFMSCNDLPCEDVKKAIYSIESKYSEDS